MKTTSLASPPDVGEESFSHVAGRVRFSSALFCAALLLALAFPAILSAQTNCMPPPPGLVSWWRGEGNALDWVGGNNGVIEGDVTYVAGKVGQAFLFDGSQAGIEVGDANNLELQEFTFECWIKRLTNTLGGSIFEIGTGPIPGGWSVAGWSFALYDDGTLALFDNYNNEESESPVGVTDTMWHHIAVSKGASNLVFYIDGAGYPSTALTNPIAYTGGATIGCETVYLYSPFNGSIDELAIYNRALNGSQIQAIYDAGSAGKCMTPSAPPLITSQPTNQTIISGDQANFTASARSSGPQGYQWSFDGTNIDGATNSALALNNVQVSQAGTYTVTVTNAYGGTKSSNAVLTVVQAQCVPAPSNIVGWWRADGNAIDRVSGNDGYSATPDSGAICCITYGPGKVGQGFVLDGYGIQLINTNNLDLQNFTIECWIQRASALVASPGNSDTGCFFGFGSGGYGFGMYNSGQIFLAALDGAETDSSIEVADTNFHHVAVTKSGTNVVFYVDGVAYAADNLDVSFTNKLPAAIGARGDTIRYQFFGTIDELSIYNRPLSNAEVAAIYRASSSGKCVPPVPVLVSQPMTQTLTAYYPATLTVFADGPLPVQYQWTFDGTNLAGATNSTLTLDAVLQSQAGTYSVIVGTEPNVTKSSNAVLTVILPAPPTILAQPASHIGVVDDYTTFTVTAQSQAPVPTFYHWSFDGTNLTGATNNELVISNLTLANAGTYAVQVSNPFFSTNSQPAVLTMIPAPTGTNRIVANLDPNELRRAMQAGGSVTFVFDGTITIPQPIVTTRDVIVDGANHSLVLSGGKTSQLLVIPTGVNVTLQNIELTDGAAYQGGAISNGGILNTSNVIFANNMADLMGGAIFNIGTLSLTGVTFSNNSAFADYSTATRGQKDELGGAIYNTNGTVNLTNVILAGNSAEITVTFDGSAGSGYGGGIYNVGGTVSLQNVRFNGNLAQGGSATGEAVQGWGFGGALCSIDGAIIGNQIECTNNAAVGGAGTAGGFYGGLGPIGYPGAGEGGAFYLSNSIAVMSNGWFVGNSVDCASAFNTPPVSSEGGALFNSGWAELTGVSFVGNSGVGATGVDGSALGNAPDLGNGGGPGGGATGGAVYNMGLLAMTNCTFTGNGVTGGNGGAGSLCGECNPQYTGPPGAPGNALGGALANFGMAIIVSNTFLNNSASGPGTNVGTIYSVCNLRVDTNTTISLDTVDSVSNASAPFLALEPQSQVELLGSTVTLTALAVGSPAPTYQWALDGTNLSSATGATLVLTNVQALQSGTYWVEATNSSGSETSAPVVLTILTAPVALTGSTLGSAGFSVSGTGIAGLNFIIEVSTNLLNWKPLQTNPSPFNFVDTNAPESPFRFYRAVLGR